MFMLLKNGVLQRRNIEIAWQNDHDAIIEQGLVDGDTLVTTPLGQVTSGVRVSTVVDETVVAVKAAGPENSTAGEG